MINKISRLSLLAFYLLSTCTLWGQVNGNKKIESRSFSITDLSKITITTPATVTIDAAAATTSLEITTDDNIFEHLLPQKTGSILTITPSTWIEPSVLTINIKTPSLEALTTGGYGDYVVKNIQAPVFTLDNAVAKVALHGQVGQLTVNMSTGKLDAHALLAKSVSASIESFGIAKLNVTDYLQANIWNDGTIVYQERPAQVKKDLSNDAHLLSAKAYQAKVVKTTSPAKVKFRLRNNSNKRKQFFVRGPAGSRFSYGFPMNSQQKRPEEWPIGTKVFKITKTGIKTLLVTIDAQDEGTIVDLF